MTLRSHLPCYWLLPVLAVFAACSGGAPETAPTTRRDGGRILGDVGDDWRHRAGRVDNDRRLAPGDVSDRAGRVDDDRRLALTSDPVTAFPTDVFARVSQTPVTDEVAAKYQAILNRMAGYGGMVATVMTANGTWSGATATADGSRALQIDDQFAIASITKSVVAAQLMLLVEAGEVSLDDLASDHLPAELDFDTNGATIRQLLSHTSGLREPDEFIWPTLSTDRQRVWTVAEVLELAGEPGWPAGSRFEYSSANYTLVGLIIEQVRGRPLAQVLSDGVLSDDLERLVYQPDERPTDRWRCPLANRRLRTSWAAATSRRSPASQLAALRRRWQQTLPLSRTGGERSALARSCPRRR